MKKADFTVNVDREGEIRILQLTDMQVIDATQMRYPERLGGSSLVNWVPEKHYNNLYQYMDELIERANPDLIIITGDIIYGEFDDSGRSMVEFVAHMDSYKIPWAPVYGNHDNESRMGVEWQNQQFIDSKYCLFAKGNVFGNGNYTVDIVQNGELIRRLCMVDSNGCHGAGVSQGIREDQIKWLEEYGKADDAPAFVCYHIPTADFTNVSIAKGYQSAPDVPGDVHNYTICRETDDKKADFGRKIERLEAGGQVELMPTFKKIGADGIFTGHCHCINTSIVCEGIRFTFGLKTGTYDYFHGDAMGGTLITIEGKSFSVEHIYCDVR
ncbi:MAG: metallophosphoesterase [Clostridia bacterium]|nr:metallophosphoesterase [Clostridia bacterium]